MKKTINILFFMLYGVLSAQITTPPSGVNYDENFIYSRTYLDATTNSSTTAKQIQGIQYFDGLGRPKQSISIKSTPNGNDLVTTIVYDEFGRQVDNYLPVSMSSSNGGIQSLDESGVVSYYNSSRNSTTKDFDLTDSRPFSHKKIEASPLDRVFEQYQSGDSWQSKPIKFDYETNTDTDVIKFVTTTTWSNGATSSSISITSATDDNATGSGYYKKNQLYKNKVTDEDENVSYEFKNGKGQTLLVRKIVSATEFADTYYVYNEYDQLAFVIPPLASEQYKSSSAGTGISDTDLEHLCYQYRYDSKNRLVEKKLPGKGWEYMVYDIQNRLVATQDVELKKKNQWLFTKYDKYGRIAYTGITIGADRLTEQQSADSSGVNYVERKTTIEFTKNDLSVYYGSATGVKSYPATVSTLLSVNYYDTYPPETPSFPNSILNQTRLTDQSTAAINTKGLPIASFMKNIEGSGWTKNYTFYDTKARPIATYSENHLGGYTKTETKLKFSGKPTETYTYHKRLLKDNEVVIKETFVYDGQERLLNHYHQVDSLPEELLTKNSYNELGQLKAKGVGNTTTKPLQEINYKYNIRGWLTNINSVGQLGNDLFAYRIKYENPFAIPKAKASYNGNISEVDWITKNDNIIRRYIYHYDSLNRLTDAFYRTPSSASSENNFYNESISYDLNGNIFTLNRNSKNEKGSGYSAQMIDKLEYSYNGNQLLKVKDVSKNTKGYPSILEHHEIEYDDNGNMTKHLDKEIHLVTYNFLNLPQQLINGRGEYHYNYRSDGVKVRETNYYYDNAYTSDYLDNFKYKTYLRGEDREAALLFAHTSEGYYDFVKNSYIYNYVDHLGNVRLSYSDNNKDGEIDASSEIIEENNYYPFGLKHEGYNSLAGNRSYQYKYNGKELQETGMYDYGARFYMPDIGRWGVVDPLAEKYVNSSPYTYAGNNPVIFIDPNGMEIINGETANREKLEKDVKQRESILNSQYGGNKNLTTKDFESKSDYKKYQTIVNGLNEAQGNLDKSIAVEKGIQSVIDNFKNIDPTNFNLANNLQYKDADGKSHNIDVVVKSGEASSYGGAFTATAFTSTKDKNGNSQYYGIHSITTTIDLKKISPFSGAFAHEMGHAYNTAMNPSQARSQGSGDSGTINCQDPANRNTFQSKTAMDWQENFIIRQMMFRFQMMPY